MIDIHDKYIVSKCAEKEETQISYFIHLLQIKQKQVIVKPYPS